MAIITKVTTLTGAYSAVLRVHPVKIASAKLADLCGRYTLTYPSERVQMLIPYHPMT